MCTDETVPDPTNHATLGVWNPGSSKGRIDTMDHYRRSVRRLLLTGACVASALVGLAAVWLFAPTGFLRLDTSDLLAVCALVVLPLLTVWAVRADRAAQAVAQERAATFEPAAPALPESSPASGQRVARKSVIHEPAYMPDPAPPSPRERV
jgi:hypothetical protein